MSWPMGEEEERRRQVRGRIRTRRRSIRIRSGREPRGRGRASHARGPSGLAVGHPRTSQGPPGVRGTAPGETQSRTLGVALGYRRRRGPGAKRGTQAKPRRGRCARPPFAARGAGEGVAHLCLQPAFPSVVSCSVFSGANTDADGAENPDLF